MGVSANAFYWKTQRIQVLGEYYNPHQGSEIPGPRCGCLSGAFLRGRKASPARQRGQGKLWEQSGTYRLPAVLIILLFIPVLVPIQAGEVVLPISNRDQASFLP